MKLVILFVLTLSQMVYGQAIMDGYSATTSGRSSPNRLGSGSPAGNCTVGDTYFRTSGVTAGQNLYLCTATNTWTQLTGTGSGLPDPGSNGIVARTGAGTTAARTITAGTGVTVTNGDGASANPTVAADTAVVLSRATDQAGTDKSCASSDAAGTSYTCTLTPTLTTYTTNMVLHWTRTNGCTSGTSLQLNVDTLGAKSVYAADGSTVLTTTECGANRRLILIYDGTNFRAVGGTVNSSGIVSTISGTSATLAGPSAFYVCTSTCTVTLPVPVAGYQFCVMNGDNVSTVITLAALGSSARYENTARTAYGTAGTGTLVSGGAAADKVCLLGLDSTHYLTVGYQGTWTAN